MFSEHALWLERIDNKYLVGWLVHVCVQLAEILPRHPHTVKTGVSVDPFKIDTP